MCDWISGKNGYLKSKYYEIGDGLDSGVAKHASESADHFGDRRFQEKCRLEFFKLRKIIKECTLNKVAYSVDLSPSNACKLISMENLIRGAYIFEVMTLPIMDRVL